MAEHRYTRRLRPPFCRQDIRIAGTCLVEIVAHWRYSRVPPDCVEAENWAAQRHLKTQQQESFGQVRHVSAVFLCLSHRELLFEVWRWFLLLDRQGSDRVTRNTDAGVLRSTPADGVLVSPGDFGIAPVSSSNWRKVVPIHKSQRGKR